MSILTVTINKSLGGVFTVSPAGPIDSNTYLTLEQKVDAILKSVPKALIFDMKDVKYISSMGITALLRAKEKIEKSGGAFVMTNLQPQIHKVFDIVKAIPSQNILTSREELDRYLAKIQQEEAEKRDLP